MENYDRFMKTLNDTKNLNNCLYEVLKYSFIHHSNKIEGSTFTPDAIQLLIEKNIVTGTHTLDDVQSTINSYYTFDLVFDSLGKRLTLSTLKEWHSSLLYRTSLYDSNLSGVFKKFPNKILGASFDTVSPLETEDRLSDLLDKYYSKEKNTLEDILKFHLEFEIIHPFQDGNGRIGRFIYLKQILENKLELKFMNGGSSKEYKEALSNSSLDDVSPLVNYINCQEDFIKKERNLY